MKVNIDFWSLLLGICSSIIIPGFIFIIKYFSDLKKKNDFIKLMKKEYIEPIVMIQTENVNETDYRLKLGDLTSKYCLSLDYLKKNELLFLTTANQFYFIRVVEYTLSFLKHIDNVSKDYEFTDTTIQECDFTNTLIRKQEVMEYVKIYNDNVKDYANLKVDSFSSNT